MPTFLYDRLAPSLTDIAGAARVALDSLAAALRSRSSAAGLGSLDEALEVFLKKKIHYEQRQFFVKGRLKLVSSSDQGLFFQIVDATAS